MLIHLQKYDFKLIQKRGKDLNISEALSRAFLPVDDTNEEFDSEINAHVKLII